MGLVLHACCVISFLGTIQGLIPNVVPGLPSSLPKIPGVPSLPKVDKFLDMAGLAKNPTPYPANLNSENKEKNVLTPFEANVNVDKETRDCTNACNEDGRLVITDTPDCQKPTTILNAFSGEPGRWRNCTLFCNGSVHKLNGQRKPFSVVCIASKFNSATEASNSKDSKSVTYTDMQGTISEKDNPQADRLIAAVGDLNEAGTCKNMNAMDASSFLLTQLKCNKGQTYVATMATGSATVVVCLETGLQLSASQLSKICGMKSNDGTEAKYLEMPEGNEPNSEPKYFEQTNQGQSMLTGDILKTLQELGIGIL